MKVIFDRNTLIDALIPASSIAPTKNTLAAVEGILFECPGDVEGTCRLSAYDLEKGLRNTIPARVIEKGKFVLNAQNILQIARSFPEGDIVISVDENYHATISNGISMFEISASSAEDFPLMPLLNGDRYYTFPQYALKRLINGTLFAVAQNDQRVALNGANFACEKGQITMTGCDGTRLAIAQIEKTDAEKYENCNVIIPGKILNEVSKIIKDSEEEVTIVMATKFIIFTIGNMYLFSRVIDVPYNDFKRFIPDTSEINAYVSMSDIKGAIERALLITEDKLGGKSRPNVKLNYYSDHLDISAVSVGGKIFESIPCAKSGPDLIIGFNCKFISDILKACPDEMKTIKMRLTNAVMGMVIENGTTGDEVKDDFKTKFTFFVAPVRLKESDKES